MSVSVVTACSPGFTSRYFEKMRDDDQFWKLVNKYGNTHRRLMQFMLKNGMAIVRTFFLKFIEFVNDDLETGEPPYSIEDFEAAEQNALIDKLLKSANAEIRRAKLRLIRIDDEYNDAVEYVVLISQLQPSKALSTVSEYTVDERNVFRKWLHGIFTDDKGEISENAALGAADGMISKRRAQDLLDSLVAGLWLQKTDNAMVRLGVKGVAELLPCFAESYCMNTCSQCSRVVIFKNRAVICRSCGFYIHRQCFLKMCSFGGSAVVNCPHKSENGNFCGAEIKMPANDGDGDLTRKRPRGAHQTKGGASDKRLFTPSLGEAVIEEGEEMIVD